MQLEDYRRAVRAEPFRPFVLHLADGREIEVRHPEMTAFAPAGRVITVFQPDGRWNLVDILLITDLEFREQSAA